MQNSIFAVNDEPYCIWEVNVLERNKTFLDGLDAEYFNYLLQTYLDCDDEKRAAVALKSSLHHSMETFFSLLGALIQAPDCTYAWIAKCSNKALHALIERISKRDHHVFTKLQIDQVSWENLATIVLSSYKPGTDENIAQTKKFGELWGKLADMFNNKDYINEYNSVKHGFRIKSGGFFLRAGTEKEYGVVPPENQFLTIDATKHGSTFLTVENFDSAIESRSIKSKSQTVGWTLEMVAPLCQLVYMSINNTISALKIISNSKPNECTFITPKDLDFFDEPWKHTPDISSICFEPFLDESKVKHIKKKELLELLPKYGKFC